MYVILNLVAETPYKKSAAKVAEELADLLEARVRSVSLAGLPDESTGPAGEFPTASRERVLDEAADYAEEVVEEVDTGPDTPVESDVAIGSTIRQCVRELARCDIGVVGKTLEGELSDGRGLGRQLEQLKRATTKPLVIVPEATRPIEDAMFVYTQHRESGHALSLAPVFSHAGVGIHLVSAIPALGRNELRGTAEAYLEEHDVPFDPDTAECQHAESGAGPATGILELAEKEDIDLIVMGGTHQGLLGRLLWPEMGHEVAWNADIPVLIWY